MTDRDPFAALTSRHWSEAALDIMVPAAAALLTVCAFLFLVR